MRHYERINKYMVNKKPHLSEFIKVRALAKLRDEEVYEVAVLSVNPDNKAKFNIEYRHPTQLYGLTYVELEDICSQFADTGVQNLQKLVDPMLHPNAEKMNITSPIGLLSSHYSHVYNHSGVPEQYLATQRNI